MNCESRTFYDTITGYSALAHQGTKDFIELQLLSLPLCLFCPSSTWLSLWSFWRSVISDLAVSVELSALDIYVLHVLYFENPRMSSGFGVGDSC